MNTSSGMCEANVVLLEQELNCIKLHVLELIRTEIVSNVEPRRHFTYLRSKNVLDERDCDEIKAIPSRAASAEKFLDVLARKGAKGYDEFCKALIDDQTQTFLLTKMSMMLDVLRAKVLENKRQMRLLHGSASADEKVRLKEQQQSNMVRQPQKQQRQLQYHHRPHEQLHTTPPVATGHHSSFPHVTQQQPQPLLVHPHSYPANSTTIAHSTVPNSSSPVPSHSPTPGAVVPGHTHHHHPGSFTIPANLSFDSYQRMHASRQYQAAMMGQELSRQDFYHSSQGASCLERRANHEPLPPMAHRTYMNTSTGMATQPRGWSTETEPEALVTWNSQSQPCGQPLLASRGQDET